ncbi:MAG TPA: DinB family protein [Candidatus Limnocylindrales bacterium]|nr:DinB family protein [Candidatus Limnocylindrales bacterium]
MTDVPEPILAPAELVARVEQGWAAFRALVDRVARNGGLERNTETGWPAKAVAAHVAAWHEQATGRLGEWRATGRIPPVPDVDAFNAQVAERTAGDAPESVLARLDASYPPLLSALRALSEADLQAHRHLLGYIVAANTFGHYEEHLAELDALT